MEGGRDRGRLGEEGEEGKLKGGKRGVRREGRRKGGRERDVQFLNLLVFCAMHPESAVFFLSFLSCFLSLYLIPSVDFPHFYYNILNFTTPFC